MLLYMDQEKEARVIDMNRVQFQTNAIKGQYYILHSSLNLENFHPWSRLHAPMPYKMLKKKLQVILGHIGANVCQ